MREIILKRIEEIKKFENGFSKSIMKWNNFSSGTIRTHISEMDFNECNDIELLMLFERIIRRRYSQS